RVFGGRRLLRSGRIPAADLWFGFCACRFELPAAPARSAGDARLVSRRHRGDVSRRRPRCRVARVWRLARRFTRALARWPATEIDLRVNRAAPIPKLEVQMWAGRTAA